MDMRVCNIYSPQLIIVIALRKILTDLKVNCWTKTLEDGRCFPLWLWNCWDLSSDWKLIEDCKILSSKSESNSGSYLQCDLGPD